MTNVYGSIENEDPNSKDLNLRDEKEHLAPKSLDSNGQGENSNDTSKKSWKLGAAIFICAAVALGRREYITEDTSDMPLFSAVQNLPMTGIERPEEILLIRDHKKPPPAFSTLDPVADLGLFDYDHRPESSSPGTVFGDLHKGQKYTGMPLPTNKWYENMVLVQNGNEPSDQQQVYTVPYVINAIGPVPGIKLHATRLLGMSTIVQVSYIAPHGVTIGAAKSLDEKDLGAQSGDMGVQRRYSVDYEKGEHPEGNVGVMGPLTPLGLTLKWETESEDSSFSKMTSSIVRGMPYGTIHYHYDNGDFGSTLPTVVSEIDIYGEPVSDSGTKVICASGSEDGDETLVEKSVEVHFWQSDYSWLVFYSEPVYVRCYKSSGRAPFVLQATRLASKKKAKDSDVVFTSRLALMNNCTVGTNVQHCEGGKPRDSTDFSALLKKHADVYPGKNTKIDYTFFSDDQDDGGEYSYLQFDWDARKTSDREPAENSKGLLMYSLPHHRDMLHTQTSSANKFTFTDDNKMFCAPSLNGQACLVDGSQWVLKEDLDGQPSFWAPRVPYASALPKISKALAKDIDFRTPGYFAKGAGDTYFSGKILAKLARILLIYKEVDDICSNPKKHGSRYVKACKDVSLPSKDQFDDALSHLRSSTEIWINGTAETPFVYDSKWAGLVSCGCLFNDKTWSCNNRFPDCPCFSDPGLDFGHGFYNDHHFHQGYHIYAASAVAYFDEEWGKDQFENVLLLIRDIANPSPNDNFFPMYRMKDWYLGNSWAGGIAMAYANGRNQESSSESIAAYESVSLFGAVMAKAWARDKDKASPAKASRARHIRDVGRLLTSTEVRAADRYWHVRQTGEKSGVYPRAYKQYAVGIMWNMMAQFQTWFGAAPYLACGIQLLPLTPVAERRDSIDWAKQLYPTLESSCDDAMGCDEEGWGVLAKAILATVGYPEKAVEYAESLDDDVFESAGGNGHSLTNTIWYYSTRPQTDPIKLVSRAPSPAPVPVEQRPLTPTDTSFCPPCSQKVCQGNKCPVRQAPFLCVSGPAVNGCSENPWPDQANICTKCCVLSVDCQNP